MFIGRKQELSFFNQRYKSKKAEFVTLYGRRRIGKTEFLTEFCKDKPALFYTCREYTDAKQFTEFSDAIFSFDFALKKKTKTFADWEDAFSALGEIESEQKLVVVIDEFPHMVKGNRSIPSVLQVLWDQKLKDCNIMLIISGSSMSFMEDEILASKNPLYGRMTAIYKMDPLPFADAVSFFPDYSVEEKIEAYAILGGIPHYLKQFDPDVSLEENIKNQILTKGTVLFGEVDYILHEELREPAAYVTILEAIACGANRFGELSSRSQIDSNKLSVYLKNLLELGLVKKETPVMKTVKEASNRSSGEYKVADNFFAFWFSCAYPYLTALSMGQVNVVYDNVVRKNLHRLASHPFEEICLSWLWRRSAEGKTPFPIIEAGRWWGKVSRTDEEGRPVTESVEIDILACDAGKKKMIAGECKFRNEPIDRKTLDDLISKLNLNADIVYYLFSLSGFTRSLEEYAAQNPQVVLIDAESLL